MHFDKRSYALKENIEAEEPDNIIKVAHNHVHTISLLVMIFNYVDTVEDKIYIFYNIFKYTSVMFMNKDFQEGFENFQNFMKVMSEKIDEFERDVDHEYRSCIPRYLRTTMLDRVRNLKKLIANSL